MSLSKMIFSNVLFFFLIIGECTAQNVNNNNDDNIMIIAHRGGAGLAPENTIAALKKGMEANADYLEIDIHQTADKRLVVCHDRSINRTTNGKGKISDMEADEIRSFRIMDGNTITDYTIPTLDEVFQFVNGKTKLLIEIKKKKNTYPDIERLLLEMIEEYNAWDWVVIQSFNDYTLQKLHSMNSTVRLEKLLFLRLSKRYILDTGGISKFDSTKYSYISTFNIWKGVLKPKFEQGVRSWGKEIKVWCIDDPSDLSDKVHPDGIITNRPDVWAQQKQ
ncbi:MAG: glycerophosphodiester phosphodiesterase family protein [Bacteroidales bacterium]|nr:glycerophosphodiester phosphodiesterase family protein [Bacteroidales bacterium]